MTGNKPLIPAHSAPRHKHWMYPPVNSTKTFLYILTCDPHQIQESWEGAGLELVLVDPPLRETA